MKRFSLTPKLKALEDQPLCTDFSLSLGFGNHMRLAFFDEVISIEDVICRSRENLEKMLEVVFKLARFNDVIDLQFVSFSPDDRIPSMLKCFGFTESEDALLYDPYNRYLKMKMPEISR